MTASFYDDNNITNKNSIQCNQIKWSSRKYTRSWNNCYTSVDGTDFRLQEPAPFDTKWYSHKFNSASMRYEVAVSLNGDIVWCHGPFPAGSWPDDEIFKAGMVNLLDKKELTVTDRGYRHSKCRTSPVIKNNQQSTIFKRIRARHEILNRRLKHFHILSSTFRHIPEKHSTCFFAVANIVQESINRGQRLFDI